MPKSIKPLGSSQLARTSKFSPLIHRNKVVVWRLENNVLSLRDTQLPVQGPRNNKPPHSHRPIPSWVEMELRKFRPSDARIRILVSVLPPKNPVTFCCSFPIGVVCDLVVESLKIKRSVTLPPSSLVFVWRNLLQIPFSSCQTNLTLTAL